MKRTTYILIGLFVAGFCMLVGGMFVMYCLGKPYFSNQINLQGEQLCLLYTSPSPRDA